MMAWLYSNYEKMVLWKDSIIYEKIELFLFPDIKSLAHSLSF